MKIIVVGTGYVGLVSGICLAKIGHEVICVDNNIEKINQLNNNQIPIYENDLNKVLQEVKQNNKIKFSNNLKSELSNSDIIFIAVGTPENKDGSADLSFVFNVAKEIAQYSTSYKLIINKSTVPAGTGYAIKNLIKEINPDLDFSVASNPEFLREGSAVEDFMNPDRIVIGTEDKKAKDIISKTYQYFSNDKIFHTNIITAELIKYASNSFLATKISFINEIANLCEKVGGNIKDLSIAIGKDSRIGEKFLNPGPGFGGSCFPKDINAILNLAQNNNVNLSIIKSVNESNQTRIKFIITRIKKILDQKIANKKIALLGLAFKANTDDIRYSPAIIIAKELLKDDAKIYAHDFAAITNSKKELVKYSNIKFCDDIYETCQEADLIIIATEWEQYRSINFTQIKNLNKPIKIFDLRNLYDQNTMLELGLEYYFIGQKDYTISHFKL